MRVWIVLTALTLILVLSAPCVFSLTEYVEAAENEGSLFSLEEESFDFFDRVGKEETSEEGTSFPKGKTREDEEDSQTAPAGACDDSSAASVLLFGGVFDKCAPFDDHGIGSKLDEKVEGHFANETLADYRAFAFRGEVIPLEEPLSDKEVAFVFARIISTYTAAVPIGGALERIAFSRNEESLFAYALITVRFVELAERYHLYWLPDHASFSLSIPFEVQCGKIAVKSDEIKLKCNTFYLPETLLVYGCNAAFGKKDYRKLFGNALENVFINAGIFQ